MPETLFSFSHLESPAPGATLPQGRHQLRGWVWPKGGGLFVDVRARIAARVFPGVHGYPRPDLAAHFQTGRAVALAEFTVAVELAPGDGSVTLEVLDIDGHWRPFDSVAFTVVPAHPPATLHVPGGPLRWHDFCWGLAAVLRARRDDAAAAWPELARRLAAELPYPRDLLAPGQPLIGFVNEPAIVAACRFGRIPVLGHVFHTGEEIRRLWASTDLQVLQPIPHGRLLPDVAAHYAQYPTAARAGFHGLVDVPAQLPNPVSLRIYAELASGELRLAHALRTRLHPADDEKRAFVRGDAATFDAALAAWRQALGAQGIDVADDPDLPGGLDRLRRDYLSRQQRADAATQAAGEVGPRADPATSTFPRRVLLVTHNLNYEGAPLFLLDYAQALHAAGAQVTVLSPAEGPLRERFAAAGATVQVVDVAAIFAAPDATAVAAGLADLGKAWDFSAADLVVANTFTTFWAVHAAQARGVRVLMYVHESTTPAAFYGDRVSPAVVASATDAFRVADAVSFTTAATRDYHVDYGDPARYVVTPGWIDVARLDAWLAAHPREGLRERFKLAPGELLVTNIATISDRKGQHTFVRAVDLFRRRHPELATRTRFVLLGGRPGVFNDMLQAVLEGLQLPNLELHPETHDYLPYYVAADVTVCSSYEESSPRVVLEAMACRAPLLASAVQGVPELVRPDLEATLLPAGDTTAWADALARLLAHPAIGHELAARARARVVNHFDAREVLPRHVALAARIAAL
jgi:glycosyltransferase involved in cell wall biosynthesis